MFKFKMSKSSFLFKIIAFSSTLLFISGATLTYAGVPIRGIGLVDSYSVADPNYEKQEDKASRSYVYDNALAAIASLQRGNHYLALEILHTLCAEVKKTTGVLFESYDFSLAGGGNGEGPIFSGNLAWLLQALNIYQKFYQDLYKVTADVYRLNNPVFYTMQLILADYLLTLQDDDPTDGGIWVDAAKDRKSTEHNIIAYVALRNFGRLNGEGYKTYITKAEMISNFITNRAWNTSEKRFNRGQTEGTPDVPDKAKVVDAQALGVLLAASLDRSRVITNYRSTYAPALDWAVTWFQTSVNFKKADNTYKIIYGFDFNENKDTIWLEGTLQMTLAFYYSGRSDGAINSTYYYNNAKETMQFDGSLPWATNKGDSGQGYDLEFWRAVASTAWLVFCDKKFNPLVLY
jgi:hypothetical protein